MDSSADIRSACFTDKTDFEMRNRVIQIIDDVLVGSDIVISQKSKGRQDDVKLTSTTRAVAVAIIVDSIRDEETSNVTSNSFKWMNQLMLQRAQLQNALSSYIDARSKERKYENGSEKALRARAEAMQRLEYVASLSSPLGGTPPVNMDELLEKIHKCRDKHIFRILATISAPCHSAAARTRAFDELPKRTKSLGSDASVWVKCLARRCAMGNFVNVDIVEHCIRLAQECFLKGEFESAMIFLNYVKTVVTMYPSLGSSTQGFKDLLELFDQCFEKSSSKEKNDINRCGILTILIEIIAAAAHTFQDKGCSPFPNSDDSENEDSVLSSSNLESQLLDLCTRRGTPDQAKNAIHTLAALKRNRNAKEPIFDALLKSLTSSSRLSMPSGRQRQRLTRTLVALSALVECSPTTFLSNPKGEKTVQFVLDNLVLVKGGSSESIDEKTNLGLSPDLSVKSKDDSMAKSRSSPSSSPKSPGYRPKVSFACQRLCKGIDFLVTYIRSTIRFLKKSTQTRSPNSEQTNRARRGKENAPATSFQPPSENIIMSIFSTLTRILQDSGLPPSTRDRKECKSFSDRAELRKCAAVNLLQLCDVSLCLESKYLSHKMWQILGNTFLDEEKDVREAVMEQLSMMLTGQGPYRQGGGSLTSTKESEDSGSSFAPSLRFLAFIVLCVDSDHGHISFSANGNAANVGKLTTSTKINAFQCISKMRITFEATMAQCRAMGKKAEKYFDECLKMKLMPEFSVTYALHLLAFRREAPSGGWSASGSENEFLSQSSTGLFSTGDESTLVTNEARHKILKKRLKWLLEPLVTSLGDGADNISFLLRMVEVIGSRYYPINVSRASSLSLYPETSATHSPNDSLDLSPTVSTKTSNSDKRQDSLSHAKLKVICVAARQVLLKFVKKDINLAPYPGSIQIPGSLYERVSELSPDISNGPVTSTSKKMQNSEIKSLSLKKSILESKKEKRILHDEQQKEASLTPLSKSFSKIDDREHFSPGLDSPDETHDGDDFLDSSQIAFDDAYESPIKSNEGKNKKESIRLTRSRKKHSESSPLSPHFTAKSEMQNSNTTDSLDDWGNMSPIPQSRSPPIYKVSKSSKTVSRNDETHPPVSKPSNTTKLSKSSHRSNKTQSDPPSSNNNKKEDMIRTRKNQEKQNSLIESSSKSRHHKSSDESANHVSNSTINKKKQTNIEKSNSASKKKSSAPIRISMGSKSPRSEKQTNTKKSRTVNKRRISRPSKDDMDFLDDDDGIMPNPRPSDSRSFKTNIPQSNSTTKRKALSSNEVDLPKKSAKRSVRSAASNASSPSVSTRSSSRFRNKLH